MMCLSKQLKHVLNLLWLLTAQGLSAESKIRTLHLESVVPVRSPPALEVLDLLSEALGPSYQVRAYQYPPKRGTELLKKELVDGTLGRVKSPENLLKIDVPLAVVTISLWCRDDPKVLLRQGKVKITHRNGAISEETLLAHASPESIEVSRINTAKQAIRMLETSRTDCHMDNDLVAGTFETGAVDRLNGMPYRFNYVNLDVFVFLQKKFAPLKTHLESELRLLTSKRKRSPSLGFPKADCTSQRGIVCADGTLIKAQFILKL